MKILHTSDWHLGHKLSDRDRAEEHAHFLNWLLDTITEQKIEMLLIAGDIFDTSNPPAFALKQYYDFLYRMKQTACKHIVVIGGNHDSAATLNAPKELLSYFNIHVVGGATEQLEDEVIKICDEEGNCVAVVCAVPFLRDKDIRYAVSGESYDERETRIKEGICSHYRQVCDLAKEYKAQGLPVIATGHLYAAGGAASDSEKEIHIGNLGQISGDMFPEEFDYIALGHLHRPQIINNKEHIRYSGSPIPLSFSEINDKKLVVLVEYKKKPGLTINTLPVPTYRKLVRVKGDLETVCFTLRNFEDTEAITPWIEIQLELKQHEPDATSRINQAAEGKNILILKVQNNYLNRTLTLDEQVEADLDLDTLDAKDVFARKLESLGIEEDTELNYTFSELLSFMDEKEAVN